MSDDRPFCEDCGIRSDLGKKCRTCYAQWSRRLWADIPARLRELREVCLDLDKLAQSQRKAVAAFCLNKPPEVTIAGRAVEVVKDVKRAIEGPYGEQLLARLQAIHNASQDKGSKTRGGEVD